MPPPLTKFSSILIVGGGTWGSSTALHLARRGYKNVTVLDPYAFPSPIAAGTDLNKIVELVASSGAEQQTALDDLKTLAAYAWRNDPVFKPYYHETGFAVAANSPEGIAYMEEEEVVGDKTDYVALNCAEDFRGIMREGVLTGTFPGWKGYLRKKDGGWAHARKACVSASSEAMRLGVRAVCGTPRGQVVGLLYDSADGDVTGVRTADGVSHFADRTILTAGAGANELLDFKKQLRPTAWTILHLRMTAEEAKLYSGIPVLFNIEKGFFLEPDEDAHEMKICDEHPGYLNFTQDGPYGARSLPFARHQVPKEAEERARQLLRETMPQLAERPFSFGRICWCADTVDREFLISRHPESASLILGVGGSGHGFMHIPVIGGLIADQLEGKLAPKFVEAFRWRPETAINRDWKALQGRWGAERKVMEFQDVKEWTDIVHQDTPSNKV